MSSAPPRLARSLLLLVPVPDREFIEGDLEEEYADRLRRGRSRADAWYWSQVLATVPPVCAHAALDLTRALIHADHPRRIPAMASPSAVPTPTTTPRPPAFGGTLLASNPPRSSGGLTTNLVSAILHCSIVGGLVLGTMGQESEPTDQEVQIVDMQAEMIMPPPPPVAAPAPHSTSTPLSLTIPDIIPDEIPAPGTREITPDDIAEWAKQFDADSTGAGGEEIVAIGATPSFTPFTVAPKLRNLDEVGTALEREYPPLLRDAGVGGQVVVWIRLDERGAVQDAQVNVSSGHPALDEAALRVARITEFSPATNRDKAVPVWVQIPITFQVR